MSHCHCYTFLFLYDYGVQRDLPVLPPSFPTLRSSELRFFGGIAVGQVISRADLLSHYDAVAFATGAYRGRRVDIAGLPADRSRTAIDIAERKRPRLNSSH